MTRASAISLMGILAIIAGCGPLWSSVSNWRPDPPRAQSEPLPEFGFLAPTIEAPIKGDRGLKGQPSSLYASMFTPAPAVLAIGTGANGQANVPSSEFNGSMPAASATPTPVPQFPPQLTASPAAGPARPSGSSTTPGPSAVPTATATPKALPVRPPANGGALELLLMPERQTMSAGDEVQLQLFLSAAPTGMSGFDIIVTIEKGNVAEVVSSEIPKFGLASSTGLPGDSAHLRAVDLTGAVTPGSTNVLLATLKLKGQSSGTTDITIQINALDDDSGMPVRPRTAATSIRVQ